MSHSCVILIILIGTLISFNPDFFLEILPFLKAFSNHSYILIPLLSAELAISCYSHIDWVKIMKNTPLLDKSNCAIGIK